MGSCHGGNTVDVPHKQTVSVRGCGSICERDKGGIRVYRCVEQASRVYKCDYFASTAPMDVLKKVLIIKSLELFTTHFLA